MEAKEWNFKISSLGPHSFASIPLPFNRPRSSFLHSKTFLKNLQGLPRG